MIYKFPRMNSLVNLEQRVFLSAILLGGSLTDYYNVIDRNYNMGSGYSIKNNTILDFGRYGMFALNMHLYQIFTWKGYEHKDLETIDPLYLNAQGDKGNVMLAVVNPIIELNLSSHFKANMEVSYYYRHTHYSYHEDIKYKTFETRLGLIYQSKARKNGHGSRFRESSVIRKRCTQEAHASIFRDEAATICYNVHEPVQNEARPPSPVTLSKNVR